MRGRTKQDHVDFGNELFISVDAREAVVIIDRELIFGLSGQDLLGELDRIGEGICQGCTASAIVGLERIDDGSATAATAADQADFDDVATLGVHAWNYQSAGGKRRQWQPRLS